MNDDADAVIERLKKRFGVETDGELSLRLLVSRSTVANWRSRGRVPERYSKVADGATDWRTVHTPYLEWSDIEREAMIITIARMVRDYADIGTDYRAFLERGMEAAYGFATYHSQAVVDLRNEMDLRETDDVHTCAQLMLYNQLFSPEAAAAALAEGVKHTSSFGAQWYRKNHPVAPL